MTEYPKSATRSYTFITAKQIINVCFKLSREAKLSKSVNKVRLPTKDKVLKPKTKCLAAGWGFTKIGAIVDDLQVVDVEAIDLKVCQKQWDHVKVNLPPNVTCAGGYMTDKGTCQVCLTEFTFITHTSYMKIQSKNQ